tara:strand:+ start:252 stop:794 length:543 start_codon:yes stop_codon:yes gene_type:complete
MIEIHDNVLIESHREQIYMFSIMTEYKIGWDDTATFEHRQYPCLHHTLTSKEWAELDIINGLQDKQLRYRLTSLSFDEATINLATPASIQFPHTHGNSTVFTYYINPEWKNEYYGETIFYDDTLADSVNSVLYKPNRAVLFNGDIPHSIRPASHIAPSYRFTLSIFFKERNFIEEVKNSS